jgi:replicative DNA helicase
LSKEKVSVFFTYSHKDEEHKEALQAHLSGLQRSGKIKTWNDRKINPGDSWENEIDQNLNEAEIIIALISSDFINSNYCYGIELKRALEKNHDKSAILLPIFVRPCVWKDAPFAKIQGLPKDANPVTSWRNIDEAWMDVAEGIKGAVERFQDLKPRTGEGKGFSGIKDILHSEVQRIDVRTRNKKSCGGMSTGIDFLDDIIDGLHKKELTIIASRPSNGCDDLARQIAAHTAITEKKPVAYFSMASPAGHLIRKFLATEGKLHSNRLLKASLDENEWPRLSDAMAILMDAQLYIDESTSLTFSNMLNGIKHFHKENSLDLVVIEDLQSILPEDSLDAQYVPLDERAFKLRALARELGVAIILVSGVERQVEERADRRPLLSDLTLWPNLADVADNIIFTYREEVYNEYTDDQGIAEIIVDKNINGSKGKVRVGFNNKNQSFTESI